jgi:hypothetical protein
MVKVCKSETHTHAPGDWSYANSVQGLDEVVRVIRAMRNGTVTVEMCADGGTMNTYQASRRFKQACWSGGVKGSPRPLQPACGLLFPDKITFQLNIGPFPPFPSTADGAPVRHERERGQHGQLPDAAGHLRHELPLPPPLLGPLPPGPAQQLHHAVSQHGLIVLRRC